MSSSGATRYWLEGEPRVQEVTLYETPHRFYLVGACSGEGDVRHVARVDRSDIHTVTLSEDGHRYTPAEVQNRYEEGWFFGSFL
jgi:hypothetical protein